MLHLPASAEDGETARKAGELLRARELFAQCAARECPAMLRRDCSSWLEDAERQVPSIVLGARDAQGNDVVDARASLDGLLVREHLDGNPIALDPGLARGCASSARDVCHGRAAGRGPGGREEPRDPRDVRPSLSAGARSVPVAGVPRTDSIAPASLPRVRLSPRRGPDDPGGRVAPRRCGRRRDGSLRLLRRHRDERREHAPFDMRAWVHGFAGPVSALEPRRGRHRARRGSPVDRRRGVDRRSCPHARAEHSGVGRRGLSVGERRAGGGRRSLLSLFARPRHSLRRSRILWKYAPPRSPPRARARVTRCRRSARARARRTAPRRASRSPSFARDREGELPAR